MNLPICGNKPNCVSSADKRTDFYIAPLTFTGSQTEAMDRLEKAVANTPRTRLIEKSDTYLKFEFTSLVFRFVDDVEFRLDQQKNEIAMRSESRIGYSDMGANRKRLEAIRTAFTVRM